MREQVGESCVDIGTLKRLEKRHVPDRNETITSVNILLHRVNTRTKVRAQMLFKQHSIYSCCRVGWYSDRAISSRAARTA